MEVKKHNSQKICLEGFSVKGMENGSIFLEGFANKSVKDRGKELIPGMAWKLDNYLKNPVLLYQHGKDENIGTIPIGKVYRLEKRDDGLKVKAEVFKQEVGHFKVLYDTIKMGGLRTFSVGFNNEEIEELADGTIIIKEPELLELSVVNIPMNQESTFTISTKSFSEKDSDKNVSKFVMNLISKDAWLAAALNNRIFELQNNEKDFSIDEAMETIADLSNTPIDEVKDVFAGKNEDISDEIIEAICEVLAINKDDLKSIMKKEENTDEETDKEDEEKTDDSTEEKDEKKPDSENAEENTDDKGNDEKTSSEEHETVSKGNANKTYSFIRSIVLSKTVFENKEIAEKWAKENGFNHENLKETEEHFIFCQHETEEKSDEFTKRFNISEGVEIEIIAIKELETDSNEKGRLATFIKIRANELNITNERIAKQMNVSLSAVSQLLNGKIRRPRKSRLESLAKLLKVPVDVLLGLIVEDNTIIEKSTKADDAFQRCVANKIPKLLNEGKTREQAIAIAISMCKEDGKCELSADMIANAIEFGYNHEKQVPPTAINANTTEEEFTTPQLDNQKQANVFLAQVVGELQKANGWLQTISNQLSVKSPEETEEIQEQETIDLNVSETNNPTTLSIEDQEKEKEKQQLDFIRKYQEDINNRLSKLGY